MPVSKKRNKPVQKKKAKKSFRPYQVVKQQMWEVPNIFPAEMDFSQRHAVVVEVAEQAVKDFELHYAKLQEFFSQYDPLYLCSFSMLYFLGHQEGVDREAIDGKLDFHSFYLETLQAFALFGRRTDYTIALGARAAELHQLLGELNRAQSLRYSMLGKNVSTADELEPIVLRMEMMNSTLAIRNWAYEPHMKVVTLELIGLVADRFEEAFGYDPIALFDILFGLVGHGTEKINLFIQRMRPVLLERDYRRMFLRYSEVFEVDMGTEQEQAEIWEKSGRNLKVLKGHLIAHSDFFLTELNTFAVEDMLALTDRDFDAKKLVEILDGLSLEFGELADVDRDHVFLDNPVHTKPFIKLEDGRYFSAVYYLFYHLGVELWESLLRRDRQLMDRYNVEKGKYLEGKVAALFAENFPNGKIYLGSKWDCAQSGKTFENDLLLLIEDFAVIVEAKSGTVTPPARRGAPSRLFETLGELVVDPARQATRFMDFLRDNPGKHFLQTGSKGVNEVDTSKIKYFIPLGVTLSSLGSIGCNLKKLIGAKVTTRRMEELAPSMSICDLQVIFDILGLQSEKLHYLSRRREFEAHVTFQGDELDLFGYYLDNGFNIGEAEFDQDLHMDFTLKSKELDPYVLGSAKGLKVKKPELAKSRFWKDMLAKLDGNGTSWLQASYILLNAPKEDQLHFERKFEELKQLVSKKKMPNDHSWATFQFGPPRRRYKIIGYPYQDISRAHRMEVLGQILDRELVEGIRGIVVIGCDLKMSVYPYNFIAGSGNTDFFDEL